MYLSDPVHLLSRSNSISNKVKWLEGETFKKIYSFSYNGAWWGPQEGHWLDVDHCIKFCICINMKMFHSFFTTKHCKKPVPGKFLFKLCTALQSIYTFSNIVYYYINYTEYFIIVLYLSEKSLPAFLLLLFFSYQKNTDGQSWTNWKALHTLEFGLTLYAKIIFFWTTNWQFVEL